MHKPRLTNKNPDPRRSLNAEFPLRLKVRMILNSSFCENCVRGKKKVWREFLGPFVWVCPRDIPAKKGRIGGGRGKMFGFPDSSLLPNPLRRFLKIQQITHTHTLISRTGGGSRPRFLPFPIPRFETGSTEQISPTLFATFATKKLILTNDYTSKLAYKFFSQF